MPPLWKVLEKSSIHEELDIIAQVRAGCAKRTNDVGVSLMSEGDKGKEKSIGGFIQEKALTNTCNRLRPAVANFNRRLSHKVWCHVKARCPS